MIRKSEYRFSEKIMLKQNMERDDDSKKSHLAARSRLVRRDMSSWAPMAFVPNIRPAPNRALRTFSI
jgi:hypothetical protein